MSKCAYVLEYGRIYLYSIQLNGSLSSLGESVVCTGAIDIAYSNASKYPKGGDYLFLASNSGSSSDQGISVYQVGLDGKLTLMVDHYSSGVDSSPQYIVGFYEGSGYYISIDQPAEQTVDEVAGFIYTPPNTMRSWNNKIIGLPDNVTGDITSLELVSKPGAGPSYASQFLLALYQNGPAKKTQVVALGAGAFGLNYIGSGEADDANGFALAADPNFVYVIYAYHPKVVGFKIESGGKQFTPLGTVAQLAGLGSAGVVSTDGKYLFVSVAWNPLNDVGVHTVISYKIGSDGLLTQSDQKPCGPITATLAIEPGGQYLYAPSSDGSIYIYEINKGDGTLTPQPPVARNSGGEVFGMAILEV